MAHIVFVTAGLSGLVNASLALIDQLQQRGHQITYASPRDIRQSLQPLAIPFVQLAPWTEPTETNANSRWQKLRHLRQRQEKAVDNLQMSRFAETLRSLSPDLLLIDIEMHPHIITAVTANYAVGLLCPFMSIWRGLQMPPIHTPIIPGQGWRGQWWGIQWAWLRYSWQKWRGYQRDRLAKVGCDYRSVLRCYAHKVGYAFRGGFGFNTWVVPYPHGQLPILCLYAKGLDFPSVERSWVRYIGPMVKAKEFDMSEMLSDGESDSKLTTFLKNRDLQGSIQQKHPLIYCGFSSFRTVSQSFLRHLITVATQQPKWDFIIGLGGTKLLDLSLPIPTPVPTNVCLLSWAPQRMLLSQADCAIIHGGPHTITECIHFGVPMLVSPLNRDDQPGNAARVIYHGLGLLHQPDPNNFKSVPDQIQQQLRILLTNKHYRDNLAKMQKASQHYAVENVATQAVEALLPTSSPSSNSSTYQEDAS
ncbi:MAG: glycosyltransferase [Cyanobacteria bacterium J06621_3]